MLYSAVSACARSSAPSADEYGTGDVALDVDAVRKALGVSRFMYYGASYSGVDVQAYAARFPSRLSAVVLDSPATIVGLRPVLHARRGRHGARGRPRVRPLGELLGGSPARERRPRLAAPSDLRRHPVDGTGIDVRRQRARVARDRGLPREPDHLQRQRCVRLGRRARRGGDVAAPGRRGPAAAPRGGCGRAVLRRQRRPDPVLGAARAPPASASTPRSRGTRARRSRVRRRQYERARDQLRWEHVRALLGRRLAVEPAGRPAARPLHHVADARAGHAAGRAAAHPVRGHPGARAQRRPGHQRHHRRGAGRGGAVRKEPVRASSPTRGTTRCSAGARSAPRRSSRRSSRR